MQHSILKVFFIKFANIIPSSLGIFKTLLKCNYFVADKGQLCNQVML